MAEPERPKDQLQKLENELEKVNPTIFKGLDPQKKKQFIQTIVSYTRIHSGPLPAPETLADYNNVLPNAAERIFVEFESQGKHRRGLEKKAIGGQVNQSYIGQVFAFIIALAFLGCSVWVIREGYEFAGSVLGVADLTALVTVFIRGKYYQKENLEAKKIT